MRCVDDSECPQNMLCYTNVSWYESSEWARGGDGCYCNTFYGWTGYPDCTELTFSSRVSIGWNGATCLLGLFVTARLCWVAFRFHKNGTLMKVSSVNVTLALILIASIGASVWALIVLLSTAVRSGDGLKSFPDQYKGRYNSILYVFSPLSIGAGSLALLNVSLTWIEIANATHRFSTSKLRRMKKAVYTFEALGFISALCGVVYEKKTGTSIMGFVLTPLIFVVLASYVFGAYKLNSILHASTSLYDENNSRESANISSLTETESVPSSVRTSGKSAFQAMSLSLRRRKTLANGQEPQPKHLFHSVMQKVRNTAVAVSVCVLLFWIATLGISAIDVSQSWKEATPPGDFSKVKGFHHLQMTAIVLGALTIGFYLTAKTTDPSSSSKNNQKPQASTEMQEKETRWWHSVCAGCAAFVSQCFSKASESSVNVRAKIGKRRGGNDRPSEFTRQTEMEWLSPAPHVVTPSQMASERTEREPESSLQEASTSHRPKLVVTNSW